MSDDMPAEELALRLSPPLLRDKQLQDWVEASTAVLRRFEQAAAAKARAEEREACAQLADAYPQRDPAEDGNGYWAAEEIAAAIRARTD